MRVPRLWGTIAGYLTAKSSKITSMVSRDPYMLVYASIYASIYSVIYIYIYIYIYMHIIA